MNPPKSRSGISKHYNSRPEEHETKLHLAHNIIMPKNMECQNKIKILFDDYTYYLDSDTYATPITK